MEAFLSAAIAAGRTGQTPEPASPASTRLPANGPPPPPSSKSTAAEAAASQLQDQERQQPLPLTPARMKEKVSDSIAPCHQMISTPKAYLYVRDMCSCYVSITAHGIRTTHTHTHTHTPHARTRTHAHAIGTRVSPHHAKAVELKKASAIASGTRKKFASWMARNWRGDRECIQYTRVQSGVPCLSQCPRSV